MDVALPAQRFAIATYNVQMRPVLDEIEFKGKNICKKLNNSKYDIICLQEGFDGKDLLLACTKFKEKVAPTKKRHFYCIVDSGLLTFSNFKLDKTYFEVYDDHSTLQDNIASKGVLMTRWKIGEGFVDVYNTHMQAGRGTDGNQASRGQATQLVKVVQSQSPPENAVIVLGDFNMGPHRMGRDYTKVTGHGYFPDEAKYLQDSFHIITDTLALVDASDLFDRNLSDWFDRCLFRSGTKTKLKAISFVHDITAFRDKKGQPLSDAHPFVFEFDLTVES